jgi:uncharacterized caspase-like protein
MKRALLIGINYIGSSCELNGCINDTINMKNLLIKSFNYKEENMILLDDSGKNPLLPTKENILKYLNQVVDATEPGDTLFVHYSGHGSYVPDLNGDEVNNPDNPGMDSVLCPCDYDKYNGTDGFILDDTLKEIVNKLPVGSKLRMFTDCCHGATILDLGYIYKNGNFTQIEALCTGTNDILTVSGSKDSQTSADAFIDEKFSGALTYYLLKVLTNVHKVPTTWLSLLTVVQHHLATEGYTQIPVLCAGNKWLLKQKIDL